MPAVPDEPSLQCVCHCPIVLAESPAPVSLTVRPFFPSFVPLPSYPLTNPHLATSVPGKSYSLALFCFSTLYTCCGQGTLSHFHYETGTHTQGRSQCSSPQNFNKALLSRAMVNMIHPRGRDDQPIAKKLGTVPFFLFLSPGRGHSASHSTVL